MNTTYTLTEGNDALNRTLFMMRYDLSKTSNENVILEQFPEPGDFENNPSYGGKNLDISKIPSTGYYKIKTPTLSEGLLKLREFFYSPIGGTTQVVLSIVGVEIGVPLVFQILDGAIIVNDAYIMVRDWNPNGPKISNKGLWEWFNFHFTTNIGFEYLCIDILALAAGFGVMWLGKSIVKSAKAVFKLLIEKFGKNFPEKIANFLEKFKPNTENLPKEITSWVNKKMSEVDKAIKLLKTPEKAIKSVVKPTRLITAAVAGKLVHNLMMWLSSNQKNISDFFKSNPNSEYTKDLNINNPTDKELIDAIIEDNRVLFPIDFKIKNFKILLNNKTTLPKYVIINNVKYKFEYKGPEIGYKLSK